MKIINAIRITGILCFILVFSYLLFSLVLAFKNVTTPKVYSSNYSLPWPGILPDSKIYKLKVLRDKIIAKMTINPIKKIEFDLLMADKTIHASKILIDKGEVSLAKDTALKGENFFSILVNDYNKAVSSHLKIPRDLDTEIDLATIKHQEVFNSIINLVNKEDKKTFEITNNFSKTNYKMILEIRNNQHNNK